MKRFFLAFAAMLMAFSVSAAELNIYASGLKAGEVKDGKVEISYLLNATATALEVQLIGADNAVAKAFPLTGDDLAKGAHKVTVDLADVATGTYTWAVKASAAATEALVEVTDHSKGIYDFYLPQGLAVDNSPESAFFGRIYVAEAQGGADFTDGSCERTKATTEGIFIYDALLEDVTIQGVTGYAGGVAWVKDADNYRQGPKRIQVAEDGTLFICDNGAETSGVWMMDPANPSADFKAALDVAGRGTNYIRVNAIDVVGTGADRVLYTLDNISTSGGTAYAYAIGECATPFAGAPTSIFTPKNVTLGVQDNAIAADGRGGYWIAQNRWGDDGHKALIHVNAAADTADFKSSKTLLPFSANISYRGVLALNPAKDLLAFGSDKSAVVFSIAYDAETGKPTLTELYRTAQLGNNIDGVAFDYAGNLYVTSASKERFYAFATPKADNTCITPAPKANTITVAAAEVVELPETLYLTPNANWNQLGHETQPRFAAYYFEGSANTWVDMTLVEGETNVYSVAVPEGYTNVIFCRMNGTTTENNWDNKYNQTDDLVIPSDGTNHYTVTEDTWDKGGGVWSVYTPAEKPAETVLATIVFKSTNDADSSSDKTEIADFIESGAEHVSAIAVTKVYQGKAGYGIKGGTSKVKGELTLTLAEPITATKIVFNAAAWQGTGAADATTLVVNGAEYVLTPEFAEYTLEVNGELSSIAIASKAAAKNRWYLKDLTIYGTAPAEVLPTEVWITPNWGELTAGESVELTLNYEPANATLGEITWAVSDQTLATIVPSEDGKTATLTANAEITEGGTVSITATANGVSNEFGTCMYAIMPAVTGPQSISITPYFAEIEAFGTLQLTAEVFPEGDYTIVWSTTSPLVTVDQNGLVTSISAEGGQVAIKATIEGHEDIFAEAWYAHLEGEVPAGIVYDLDGGKVLPATNEELYHLIAAYYPTFAQKGRVLQAFDPANTSDNTIAVFLNTNTDKMMTDATSEYKWLGDYMISKEASLGEEGVTNSNWTYSIQRFLYAHDATVGTYGEKTYGKGDWTVNGQPAAWQTAENIAFVLPTSTADLGYGYTWDFLLPSAVKEGYDFKGWKDAAGNVVTSIPANTEAGTYTAQWEAKQGTGLENAGAEQVNVRKVFENGNVYILRDGVKYTITGIVVE